jgi:hypothetical protein
MYNNMLYISHRGNIQGPQKDRENKPLYILNALAEGFQVEIDVWYVNNIFMLGHDTPEFEVGESFLEKKGLWCHAKNIPALERLLKNKKIHCFFHDTDDCTITSKKYIWTYPGKPLTASSIAVVPEKAGPDYDWSMAAGVCSDYVLNYRKD